MADRAVGDHILTKSHVADEAIEANRFVKLVTSTGAQPHVVKSSDGEAAIGVSRVKADSGKICDVVIIGTAWVYAAENIAAGDLVASADAGQAEVADSTDKVLGQAHTDANATDLVLVRLSVGGAV
jgi:hypothetical protein